MEVTHDEPPMARPDRLGQVVLAIAVLLALVQLLLILLAPGPWEANVFRDDAYYQFVVARNLVEGAGFTFDGVHAAGGVQVLWALLLALPAYVLGTGAIPASAAVLGVVLHVLTALLALRLVSLIAPRVVAYGLCVYLASRPLLVAEAVNGQETALAMFTLMIWARRAMAIARGDPSGFRGYVVWTVLLPWVRTDLLLFPLGLAIWNRLSPYLGGAQKVLGPGEAALAVSTAVYVVLQKVLFGHWLPASGFAIPWWFHEVFATSDPSFGQVARRYWWYVRPLLLGGPWVLAGFGFGLAACWLALAPLAWRRRWLPLLLVVLAAALGAADYTAAAFAAFFLLLTGGAARRFLTSAAAPFVLGLWLGFFLLLVLHLPLRWYPRDYYFAPGAVCGLVTVALLAARWLGESPLLLVLPAGKRIRMFWIVLLLLLPADGAIQPRRFPWQEEMSFAARHAGRLVGDDAGIAAFNAGLLGWHHPGPVRNLDGVVDGAVLPAARAKQLVAWLRDEGIEYVLDSPRQVRDDDPDPVAPHASGRLLGPRGEAELEALVAFDLPGVGGRHDGTDCQTLYGFSGASLPDAAPRVLARTPDAAVVVLPAGEDGTRPRYVVERDGREAPLRLSESALQAPIVVTRIDGASGRIRLDGAVIASW